MNDNTSGKVFTIIDHFRSHITILYLYLSKVSLKAIQQNQRFYLKPLPFTPAGVRPWFWPTPLAQNKLQLMVKNMFHDAKI